MTLFAALDASRRCSFMLCRLGKSLYLVFYFVKNREDDFSLRYTNSFIPNIYKMNFIIGAR